MVCTNIPFRTCRKLRQRRPCKCCLRKTQTEVKPWNRKSLLRRIHWTSHWMRTMILLLRYIMRTRELVGRKLLARFEPVGAKVCVNGHATSPRVYENTLQSGLRTAFGVVSSDSTDIVNIITTQRPHAWGKETRQFACLMRFEQYGHLWLSPLSLTTAFGVLHARCA